MECGSDLNFKDVRVGDTIDAFSTEKMEAELGGNVADMKAAAARQAARAEEPVPANA